ncbi:hypothetical protein ZOSMA_276G00030 [Zostera marina]|uniref:Uncharacterized protein n=1 Tax=Zostera marina TaxID=29655 RepID=A0A0K9PDY1_ZOSMR|nr:hypothetical protein ZOSMA_276G00030 [Zostera marina]
MISISHRNAQMYFDRDVGCVYRYFGKRLNLSFNDGEKTAMGMIQIMREATGCHLLT